MRPFLVNAADGESMKLGLHTQGDTMLAQGVFTGRVEKPKAKGDYTLKIKVCNPVTEDPSGNQIMNPSISISLLVVAALLSSCGKSDQAQAVDEARQVQAALKELMPGTIATSASGYAMKAKLNGKDWVAASMMPQEAAGRIIGYKNSEYIGLPYDRRYLVVGKTIKFGENQAVDLATHDDVGIWGGRKGEMQITQVDEKSAEGTFFFTATASGTTKTVEVTEGTFRILLGTH